MKLIFLLINMCSNLGLGPEGQVKKDMTRWTDVKAYFIIQASWRKTGNDTGLLTYHFT